MIHHYFTRNKIHQVRWTDEYGILHREDGPAIMCNDGYKWWFINGELHALTPNKMNYDFSKICSNCKFNCGLT
jgi:hypothetical protein